MHSLMIFGVITLFLTSCGDDVKLNEEEGASSPVTSNNPPTIEVKDRSKPLPLQASIPTSYVNTGWAKKNHNPPAIIPATLPKPNQVYYSAEKKIGGLNRTVSVIHGDLLAESDTIVNAANSSLEGGAGIDGAIHQAALMNGQDLMKEEAIAYKKLLSLGSFPVGSAMATHAYSLAPKIKMVIFTVGPHVNQGVNPIPAQELELYSSTYNSLLKANSFGAKSISFPAVSTGIFNFPKEKAAELFFKAVLKFFDDKPTSTIEHVRSTNFDQNAQQETVKEMAQGFQKAFP